MAGNVSYVSNGINDCLLQSTIMMLTSNDILLHKIHVKKMKLIKMAAIFCIYLSTCQTLFRKIDIHNYPLGKVFTGLCLYSLLFP